MKLSPIHRGGKRKEQHRQKKMVKEFDGWASVSNEALIMIALYRIMRKLFTESGEAILIIGELKKRFEKEWDSKLLELNHGWSREEAERRVALDDIPGPVGPF